MRGIEEAGLAEVSRLQQATDASELQAALHGMETVAARWKTLCRELEEEVCEASDDILRLEGENATLEAEKAEQETQIASLSKQIREENHEGQDRHVKVKQATTRARQLEKELVDARSVLVQLEGELSDAKSILQVNDTILSDGILSHKIYI